MSYSFSFFAPTKAEAERLVGEKMAAVVEQQPNHKVDFEAAVNAGKVFVDLLAEPSEGEEVYVSMSGSVSWTTVTDTPSYTSASAQVSASIRAKQPSA